MDYKTAFEALEIDIQTISYQEITQEYLKKRYYKLSLQYHPDRNSSKDATDKFQKLAHAYEYLKREIEFIKGESKERNEDNESKNYFTDGPMNQYIHLLSLFIQEIIKNHSDDITCVITKIIEQIVLGYKKVTVHLFEELDKETSVQIYEFLSKYRNLLYIQPDILTKVREIIIEKHKNDQIYILNPSIDDLLDQNVYKLNIDGEIYFVPLWHINSDILYDKVPSREGNKEYKKDEKREEEPPIEIIVRCIPELPENIWIDEDENLHIFIKIEEREKDISLYDTKSIPISIGKKWLEIPVCELFIRRFQTYVFKRQGLVNVKNGLEVDLANINLNRSFSIPSIERTNIIVEIEIL